MPPCMGPTESVSLFTDKAVIALEEFEVVPHKVVTWRSTSMVMPAERSSTRRSSGNPWSMSLTIIVVSTVRALKRIAAVEAELGGRRVVSEGAERSAKLVGRHGPGQLATLPGAGDRHHRLVQHSGHALDDGDLTIRRVGVVHEHEAVIGFQGDARRGQVSGCPPRIDFGPQ